MQSNWPSTWFKTQNQTIQRTNKYKNPPNLTTTRKNPASLGGLKKYSFKKSLKCIGKYLLKLHWNVKGMLLFPIKHFCLFLWDLCFYTTAWQVHYVHISGQSKFIRIWSAICCSSYTNYVNNFKLTFYGFGHVLPWINILNQIFSSLSVGDGKF